LANETNGKTLSVIFGAGNMEKAMAFYDLTVTDAAPRGTGNQDPGIHRPPHRD